MGAKLGKSKSMPISEKINGHGKEIIASPTNHIDRSSTLEKKIKKKKEKISNKTSLDSKVDKYTIATESVKPTTISASSSCIKHLVEGYNTSNNHLYTNQSETASKDVLEFRNACIRRGIISPETHFITLPTTIEYDQQENIYEESKNEPETIIDTNNEPIQNEQQQQVES